MPTIRCQGNRMQVMNDDGVLEDFGVHVETETLRAFEAAEAARMRTIARRWPRRLLWGFGFLSIAVYLLSVWAEGRP